MKILMFCPQFAPLIGGAERQAERLANALRARGIDVEIWTPLIDPSSPREELRDGLPVHRFPLYDLSKRWPGLSGIGLVNAPWIVLQLAWRLWAQLGKADLVHCHIGSLQTVAVGIVASFRRIPSICKAALAGNKNNRNLSDLGEMIDSGFMGRLAAQCSRVIFTRWVATTDAVRDALLGARVSPKRIVVISNGINIPQRDRCWTCRPVRRFLYLGRLSTNTQRDVPTLIHSFDCVADRYGDVELALVGGGDLLDETRAKVRTCRNATRIRVPGFGDADEWLGWADCLVLPSRREGLSNALLEAMARGLPIIANDIPPNRETLANADAGVLVPVGDEEALVAAMKRFVDDLAFASNYGAKSYNRVANSYSLNSVSDQYIRLYESLLVERRSR